MYRLLSLVLLLSTLTGSLLLAQAQKKNEPELTKEEQAKLAAEAERLKGEGMKFYQAARFSDAATKFRQVLELCRKLYPPARFPEGHPELAQSLNNLAFLLQAQGQYAHAESFSRDALAMDRKLYPLARFPDGHPHLAQCLNNLASMFLMQGMLAQAEPLLREALAMRQRLYPPARYPAGHPDLANSLNSLAFLLEAQGQYTHAEPFFREALAMRQRLYPPARYPAGHPDLVVSLSNLASLLRTQGKLAPAEPLYRDALAMRRKMYSSDNYPAGHPDLAMSLNNLATLLQNQGQLALAEPLYREALAMTRKHYPVARYPAGHPNLAMSLNNLATLLRDQGQLALAEPLYREALAMLRKFYPSARYPDGHHDLACIMNNLATLLRDQGQLAPAESLYRDALAMYQRLTLAHATLRGEGETLTLLTTFPDIRDSYLSLFARQSAPSAAAYAPLWSTRGSLTRLAEQKHLAVRAAHAAPAVQEHAAALVALRRQRAHLLLAEQPQDPATVQARDRQLEAWDRQINDLAATLREKLPALRESQRQAQSTPADLQKALPAQAVFVDLLRYTCYEFDPAKPGKEGEKRSLRYVAFLVTKEQIHRIDLGPAAPIDAATKRWRESITHHQVPLTAGTLATLRRLVWEPLEKHFPPGTTTVYLCPDQQLCFLPWAALPGKKAETVLLEDYTLAIVPHGEYLFGQLTAAQEKVTKQADLLVLGGVQYDDAPVQAARSQHDPNDPKAVPVQAKMARWPYLQGTTAEADAVRKLAEQRHLKTQLLAGTTASTEQFKQALPQARLAHLATHGFFSDPQFRSVFQIDEKLFAMRGRERVGAGALLPSLLSGLVLAGANRPETLGRGIVTAEELFDLDLTGMELAVLSACETGLGEVGGGEGVFGLQRAFHVAGCQNVIASLWKVGDVPTLVLMEEFYRNLWEKKLSKREALRQAQLTVYRQPELVEKRRVELRAELKKAGATKEQLAQRGIEDEAVPLPIAGPGAPRRSPPAWWAAFLLSGLGD